MMIEFKDCNHKKAGKAPMDSTIWFCDECGAKLDFGDDSNLYIATFKDGREPIVVPKP